MSGKHKKQGAARSAESAYKGDTLLDAVKGTIFPKFKMLRDEVKSVEFIQTFDQKSSSQNHLVERSEK